MVPTSNRYPDGRVPVLYLAPWVDLGGSDKGTVDWFRHVDHRRWSPSLITTQPSPNRWLAQVEPYAEEIWELPDLMPGALFPSFILGFIESRGVEVVHIMNSRLGFDLLPDIKALGDPPAVVVQLHAEEPDRSGYVRYVTRRYGNLVDAFSVTSEQLKGAVTGYGIPPSKVDVIYTGVDAELEFNPERVEPLALPGNGTPRILWPGRLVEQKDPLLTLDVLRRVREHGADFVLDVVGDGDLTPVVRARAEELGVADAIEWHPPSQDMAPWYRSADLLLMTSVFEGVPYVMYEALAMGVPIVAPALPGNLEFMDADSGALVEPRDDVDQYADAVVALLADSDRRRSMGARSRERMLADFSLSRMGRDHDALYERLLAARQRELAPVAAVQESARTREANPAPATPRPSTLFARTPPPPRTVGIVIPCYRHGIYLDECIASVRDQTLAPAAIVVVDDGSDDPETHAALAALDDDPDVTVLRQERRCGPSAARNRALAELDTSYVLPLDADDLLLPDALERMVAQLEAAPPDVGFVYPNAEHTGNRSDYIPSPAYNLWLLMADNYCPAPALFDRRAFDTGASYPEDMVLGHEDWDLFLQLGAQGIRGEHARGRTFLYRKYGFSRITAVENGCHEPGEPIDRRHPALFRNRDAIKARWSPAVSVVLADEGADSWRAGDLEGRPEQTCRDYEILAAQPMGEGVRSVEAPEDSPAARLQACVSAARGRWVCVLGPRARASIRDRSLVERLIHCFWDHERTSGVVLAEAPELGRAAFSQLDDEERLEAWPVGVAVERVPEQPTPPVELGVTSALLTDLVVNVQAHGPLQWRLAPRLAPGGFPSTNDCAPSTNGDRAASANGHVGAASENAHRTGRRREAADRGARRPVAPGVLTLDRESPADRADAWVHRAVAWQEPRLPGHEPGTARRWDAAASWVPPETLRLCRHRAIGGDRWIVTTSRQSPAGYSLAYDLGVVHRHAFPGTRRLIAGGETFALTDAQDELHDGRVGLGYVEQVPLPMLDVLELRRDPETGAHVLVAGPDDPLFNSAEPLATLGWIEPFPINPRRIDLHLGPWGAIALRRYVDRDAWRHGYRTGPSGDEADAVALGSLLRQPGEALVELRLLPDGRVESDLTRPSRPSPDPMRAARWTLAPLTWGSIPPPAWAQRATASRARHLARSRGRPKLRRAERDRTLGWLRRAPADGYSALLSATHPVTGDQFLTRSQIEATDLGYRIDGVLGYLFNAGADAPATLNTTDVLWGSRFGKGRRYAAA